MKLNYFLASVAPAKTKKNKIYFYIVAPANTNKNNIYNNNLTQENFLKKVFR